MSVSEGLPNQEVVLYIRHAHQMLEVAAHNLADGFYGSAVNRAYYTIFYTANAPSEWRFLKSDEALLATKGLSRSKHSGVIAAFRQHFVKSGSIETKYGNIYGRVMDDRHTSDYDVGAAIEPDRASTDLQDARRFVHRVERYLQERNWL